MDDINLNISELKKQKRPLFMTELGIDSYADMLGGGGDVWTDRLPTEWPRVTGQELTEEEAQHFESTQGARESVQSSQESGAEAGSDQEAALGAGVSADVNVSGISDTLGSVKDTVLGTVTEAGKAVEDTLGGAVGGILGGKKSTKKKKS